MNEQDNFAGGFLLGSVIGGIVGGFVGTLLASRRSWEALVLEADENSAQTPTRKGYRRQLAKTDAYPIESARQGLEAKIAQLNDAIDDVRQQLSPVNGSIRTDQEVSHQDRQGDFFP